MDAIEQAAEQLRLASDENALGQILSIGEALEHIKLRVGVLRLENTYLGLVNFAFQERIAEQNTRINELEKDEI